MNAAPLTIAEVAQRWRYSVHSVRRLIKSGKLACLKIGPRRTLVPLAAVEAFERTVLRGSLLQGDPTIETATLGPSSGAKADDQDAIARARMTRSLQSARSKNS